MCSASTYSRRSCSPVCWPPRMVDHGGGAIVNIGSITGLRGSSGSAVYSANKAAIHSFTQSWADEYGPHGVRVNAVAPPGPIGTERQVEFADHIAPTLSRLPSRRVSTPEEIAAAVVFLVSDDAANIHGTILSVDGGLGRDLIGGRSGAQICRLVNSLATCSM